MLENLWNLSLSPLNFIIRGSIVYISVLLLLRLGGKRQMGQMSPTEFVAILLISNAVQNSMNGGDNSVTAGLILASVLIFLSWLVSYFSYRSRHFSALFEGTPRLLIHRGQVVTEALKKERLTRSEMTTLLRKQGIHNYNEVHSAVLEADGTLSIIKEDELKKT
jgi:uncharacterized membrane protein YcaP (DUF421 family)